MVEGVHDGLPGRDVDEGEGAGDAALYTAKVRASHKNLFILNIFFTEKMDKSWLT